MTFIASVQSILNRAQLRRAALGGSVALLVAAGPVRAGGDGHTHSDISKTAAFSMARSDSSDVVAALARFHSALSAGDSAAAMRLIAADALVLESGDVETRAEYEAHHLRADIDFAKTTSSVHTVTRVVVQGDMAWVTTTSVTQGTYRGRTVNSVGVELAVLGRTSTGWQIRAAHWSSHAKRA